MLVPFYNWLKSLWSRLNDDIKRSEPRAPLPLFATPRGAWEYLNARYTYTGDPLGGAADFYLHPERLQAALEAGPAAVKGLSIDCDDVASWSYAALAKIPGCNPTMFTLMDNSGKFGHHVICGFRWNGQYGAIDTNGYRPLATLDPATLCATWTQVYSSLGYTYDMAVVTPYPF